MTIRRLFPLIILMILLASAPFGAQAQETDAATEQPVVFAVLFYSPGCPHCHTVIGEDLPPLQQQYGDQLEVLLIDVQNRAGGEMYYAACEAFNVPQQRCGAVPAMVVDDQVLIGAVEIPENLPLIIEQGLARGGIGLPAIPGLQAAYDQAFPDGRAQSAENAPAGDSVISTSVDAEAFESSGNWIENFERDPVANGLAVVVLALLLGSTGTLLFSGVQFLRGKAALTWISKDIGWFMLIGLTIFTMFIALTLALEQDGFAGPSLLAVIVLLVFTVVLGIIWEARRDAHKPIELPKWLFPVLSLAGLVVAGYLLYVEAGENEAVCGAVGNCNAVQASEYAELFGVLPIGGLGVIGYLMLLATWVVAQRSSQYRAHAQAGLLLLSLFGVAFSMYLTFLEPFVIGATCAWCLTSAMVMLMLLWISAPDGWHALRDLLPQQAPPKAGRKEPRAT